MLPIVENINFLLALGTVAVQVASVGLLVLILTKKDEILAPYVARYGLVFGFVLVCAGSFMTLLYSEVFGFVPCGLCWLQRVALYPQVVILGIGAYLKDAHAALYSIALAVFGAAVGLYQHYIQMGGSVTACPTSGGDCSKRILFEFDYITFPLMSASLFIFLILLMLVVLRHTRRTSVSAKENGDAPSEGRGYTLKKYDNTHM